MDAVVYFAHGKESGPWGSKITYLARIAGEHGLDVVSPDYSQHSHGHDRLSALLALLAEEARPFLLVGSSMGGWVSAMAACRVPPLGLFLMAPAFDMPEHDTATLPADVPSWLVHGWEDDIVPVDQSINAARERSGHLLLVPDGHALAGSARAIRRHFRHFLNECVSEKIDSTP
ncbi:alpha/beta fold hydrolase [Natronospira bacteriovora]|uniref:Alpha/beta fold hydrolase n=1 Tax=Natronospira bacteriovora TaxID=3069753 RepID=A0ABU0W5K2_9GAMM|nr:alpha/beta fold hydrolase [Natronospira sp. AB-CW4]MDQ2069242.1 alpha/beta fold hydrolase [Natronospira sp. AB-CW4]